LPHDEVLRSTYFRFDLPEELPFFEFEAKDLILAQTVQYLKAREIATHAARAVSMLEEEDFPDTWEDQIALSSLASLLTTFMSKGYHKEGEMVSDSISSYTLYETTKFDSGSHWKLIMAASADQLALFVEQQLPWSKPGAEDKNVSGPFSPAFYLNSSMAYCQFEGHMGGAKPPEVLPEFSTLSDFAAASYFFLTAARRRDPQELQSSLFINILRQLSTSVSMIAELTPTLIVRVETLLKISSLAVLCEAAFTETLSAESRILLSGNFIRRLSGSILQSELMNVDVHFLEPVANAISAIIRLGNWPAYRDPLIIKLLSLPVAKTMDYWGFVNLAVEREHMRIGVNAADPIGKMEEVCVKACQNLMAEQNPHFQTARKELALLAVERGYIGLLRKLLEADDLRSPPRTDKPRPSAAAGHLIYSITDKGGNNLLHLSARRGFLPVHKMIVESLGTVRSKSALSSLNYDGLAPLHIACLRRGDIDIMLLCLYAGGDLNQLSSTGRTALHYCFPEKEKINEYLPGLEDFVQKHKLLITMPVRPASVHGLYNEDKKIENRTFMLRGIIRQLYCRGGKLTIQDHSGATPAHLAARNGWGINTDLLFIKSGAEAEKELEQCLRLRDNDNNSILATMRISGDIDGEKIISTEMRKRCMDTSPDKHPQTEYFAGPSQSMAASHSNSSKPSPNIAIHRVPTPNNSKTTASQQSSPISPFQTYMSSPQQCRNTSVSSVPSRKPVSPSPSPMQLQAPDHGTLSFRPPHPSTSGSQHSDNVPISLPLPQRPIATAPPPPDSSPSSSRPSSELTTNYSAHPQPRTPQSQLHSTHSFTPPTTSMSTSVPGGPQHSYRAPGPSTAMNTPAEQHEHRLQMDQYQPSFTSQQPQYQPPPNHLNRPPYDYGSETNNQPAVVPPDQKKGSKFLNKLRKPTKSLFS
jgi:hypothetical protein